MSRVKILRWPTTSPPPAPAASDLVPGQIDKSRLTIGAIMSFDAFPAQSKLLQAHTLSCCRPQRTTVYTSYLRLRRASMIVEFCRWGNSLAVRIPKTVADALKVSNGKRAEIRIENGTLVLRPILKPARKPRYTLDELLSGMTRDNVPQEVDWGPQRGNEAW
jgi:antitoxin MazE